MRGRTFVTALLCVLAVASWAFAGEQISFPMIGGALGQIVQLNVRQVGDPNLRCQATLGFRDGRNQPVGPSQIADLGPDQATFLRLSFNQLVARLGQRFELRATVMPTNRDDRDFGCQASVEIFEPVSGRTITWQAPPEPDKPVFQTPPEGDLPPVSGVLGQVMRFEVVRTNVSGPCAGDLILHNSRGEVVAQTRVELGPGQADFLDLNLNSQLLRFGERGLYLPCIQPAGPGSINGCATSVQVFEQLTGWTTVYVGGPRR